MLLSILLTIHIIVCIALVGVILLQRSEGGAFGMGGGAQGNFMTARGAGDLLTRTTAILAGIFFVLSLTLTLLSGHQRTGDSVINRMKIDNLDVKNLPVAPPPGAPAPGAPSMPGAPGANGGVQAPTPEVGQALPAAPPNSTPNPPGVKTQPADPLANLSLQPTQPANR